MNITFGNNEYVDFNILIITGACRSGKTLVSQILASMRTVEWIEEPWFMGQIPILSHFGVLDRKIAISLVRANCKELINNQILMRTVNFRPNDLSTVWKVKEPAEIFDRLVNLETRKEVENLIQSQKPLFILDLPEINSFLDFFYEAFPNLKVLHIVRNGYCVAKKIEEKMWFSKKNLVNPKNNQAFNIFIDAVTGQNYYMPWWLKNGEESKFINYDEYSKGLYYWHHILNFNNFYHKETTLKNYRILRYEDFVENPDEIVSDLKKWFSLEETDKTKELRNRIHKNELYLKIDFKLVNIDDELSGVANRTMRNYGY